MNKCKHPRVIFELQRILIIDFIHLHFIQIYLNNIKYK
jgi:hypothetical protein